MNAARIEIARELTYFVAVGAVGFAIDAALFAALMANGWGIVAARAVSASCSITTTWALNRRLTFVTRRSPRRGPELLRYSLAQTAGLAVNFGVFALALQSGLAAAPLAALALGAAAALAFNFASARLWAFRRSEPR